MRRIQIRSTAAVVALVCAAVPMPALAAVHLTSGRAKHDMFQVLRHWDRFESDYDNDLIHGPVFQRCKQISRRTVGCWFALNYPASGAYLCGHGRDHLQGVRDGFIYTRTKVRIGDKYCSDY